MVTKSSSIARAAPLVVCVAFLLPSLHGCDPPAVRPPAEPARAPVIAPNDSSWARLAHSCPADAPVRLSAPRAPPAPGRVRTRDDHAAELARRVPGGYGGLYVEYDPPLQPDGAIRFETRRAVVFLVDTAQREAALRALSSITTHPEQLPLNVVGARTRPARWSFAELYDWYGTLLTAAFRAGAVTSDIDEKENRIVFGVQDARGRRRLEQQLARLELPCFLVGIREPRRLVPG
jgi:hypothetical protein